MPNSPQYLSGNQIRQTFLDFYAKREHEVLPSASLIPDDPTVLLTIAGMLPFKPIFLGQKTAPYKRATTSQKCIRTNDVENVGRTKRHHTFFEMLGNFSFGDYFKEEAIQWAWELSTEGFGLEPERLIPSVYQDDEQAFAIWRDKIGIPSHRIKRMGEDENFWAAGPTGPCGPCSELYYDFYPDLSDQDIDLDDDSRFIEFYNLVFMEFNRDRDGNLTPLQNQNIDTGLGLERMAQILQQVPNNYETDLIFPIIQTAAEIAKIDYNKASDEQKVSLKVIGDHARAVVHMIADGITASNLGRGYVLRRLIRRVVRHGRLLGISQQFTPQVAETVISLMEQHYSHLREAETLIKQELKREESRFLETLERGEKVLAEILEKSNQQIAGEDAFVLYDTYGFPLELTQEVAQEKGLSVDLEGFEREMEKQRQRSQAAQDTVDVTVQGNIEKLAQNLNPSEFVGYTDPNTTAHVKAVLVDGKTVETAEAGNQVQIVLDQTPFYAESGGQIGDRGYLSGDNLLVRIEDVQEQSHLYVHFGRVERGTLQVGDTITATIDRACRRRAQAHHTATHLLHAALKQIIDPSVSQAGSLVAFDRLRFDFNCPRAIEPEDLQQVEDTINHWIAEAHETQSAVMPFEQAKAQGAIAMFGEKYDDVVRVIDVPGVSMELCGGTHVNNTAEIGLFKIISETSISSGIRRIEAVAGPAVLEYLNQRDQIVRDLSSQFKAQPEELPQRIENLQSELKSTQKELEAVKQELALAKSDQLLNEAETVGEFQLLVAQVEDMDAKALQTAADRLRHKLGEAAVVLGSVPKEGKVSLVAAFSPQLNEKGLKAGNFIGDIAKICGGGGGGRPNLAQAGGKDASKLPEALQTAQDQLREKLG